MSEEIWNKYRTMTDEIGFLVELANATSLVLDNKIHKIESIHKDDLTNYTIFMQNLNLMAISSCEIMFTRKILKNKKYNSEKHDKFNATIIKFQEAALSLVKSLEYFKKLDHTGLKNNNSSDKNNHVNSIADILALYLAKIGNLTDQFITGLKHDVAILESDKNISDKVKTKLVGGGIDLDFDGSPVIIGSDEVWIGGFQAQQALTKHVTKLELLKHENDDDLKKLLPIAMNDIFGNLYDKIKSTGLTVRDLGQLIEVDKLHNVVNYAELVQLVKEYLTKHSTQYNEYISSDVAITDDLLNSLEKIDSEILKGYAYKEFETIDNIKTKDEFDEKLQELRQNVNEIKLNPPKRAEILSEIRYELEQLDLATAAIETYLQTIPDVVDLKPSNTDLEFIESFIEAEQKLLPTMNHLEELYNTEASVRGKIADLWYHLMSDDVKETCIKRTALVLRMLIRKELLQQLCNKRFECPEVAEDIKNINVYDSIYGINIYHDVMDEDALMELIHKML